MANNKYVPATVTLPVRRLELKRSGELLLLNAVRTYDVGGAGTGTLVLRELEEVNRWARQGALLHFGWFMLILAVNGVGVIWVFTAAGFMPRFAPLLFAVFVLLDLVAAVVTFFLWGHLKAADTRVKEVLETLSRQNGNGSGGVSPQSAVPLPALGLEFFFTCATLFLLFLFWAVLTGWGWATNFSNFIVKG